MAKIIQAAIFIILFTGCATKDNLGESNYMKTDEFLSRNFFMSCTSDTLTELEKRVKTTKDSREIALSWYNLGSCYLTNDDYKNAKYYLDLFLALEGRDKRRRSNAITNVASILDLNNQTYLSLELYNQALSEDKNNYAAAFLRGLILLRFGEYDEASSIFFKLTTTFPNSEILAALSNVAEISAGGAHANKKRTVRNLTENDKKIFQLASELLHSQEKRKEKIAELEGLESRIELVNKFKLALINSMEINEKFKN